MRKNKINKRPTNLNNHIYRTERNAINFRASANRDKWYPNLNVIVKNNLIEKVPGDGIVIFGCDGAIVEHNTLRDFPDILPDSEAAAGIWPLALIIPSFSSMK